MNTGFHSIDPKELSDNPFAMIGDDWLLITAGNMENHNTMTASWGGIGILWNKPVATVYIRPQRYTKEFVDREEYFTLSVLPNTMRKELTFCGRNSGRDVNKDQACGLTPFIAAEKDQTIAYAESRLILVCRKLYSDHLKENCFIDSAVIEKNYPERDYHQMYIGEIIAVLQHN